MSLADAKRALVQNTLAKNISCSPQVPIYFWCEDTALSAMRDGNFGGSPRLTADETGHVDSVSVAYRLTERHSFPKAMSAFIPEWGEPTTKGESRAIWKRKTHYATVLWEPWANDFPMLTVTLEKGKEFYAP